MFRNAAAEFVYIRTYSKWIEESLRRESWPETVERFIQFIVEERGENIPPKVIRKIRQYLLNFDVMPSMRFLWAAGDAARHDNTCIYNCSFQHVNAVEAFAETLYILMCGVGAGFGVSRKNTYNVNQLPIVPKMSTESGGTIKIEDSKVGWADSVKQLIFSLYNGKDIEFDYSLLRPKGARLKTMGGRSSGPAPLISLHQFIRQVFSNAQGRKLTTLECHDIENVIAEIVVVGGVRRSSEISLSDLDDIEMRNSKVGNYPLSRAMANNSAIYLSKPTAVEFLNEWSSLAASGTGERGIFNLEGARKNSPKRRDASKIEGTNPCVSGDTEILTKLGYQRIDSLVDQEIEIWNGFEWSNVTPKITGQNQPMVLVTFSDGRTLKCTEYHNFHISKNYKGDTEIIKAKDLEVGMKLIKHEFPILEQGNSLENAYLQGFHSAEGMDNYKYLYLYEPKKDCLNRIKPFCKSIKFEPNEKRYRIVFYDYLKPKCFVPFDYNLKTKLDWLSGLFDGDGTELKEGGLQLTSVDVKFLEDLQKLLSTLGIQSKVVPGNKAEYRSMPDGNGGYKSFYCQESKRICIGATQIQKLKSLGLSCERLKFNKTPQRDASQFVTVVDVTELPNEEFVYCFNEPKRHLGIFNGVITGQCGEIMLRHKQFCNLSEVVVRKEDDVDDLMDKVECATWIGVIQSTFTYFPYLSKEWKENCEEERLLGVSLTGQMDNPEILTPSTLKALKNKAIKVAKLASQKMNINMPAAITCVKPSGTVSQLVDSASGLHVRYSEYYIRRYRISATDPLYKLLKDQKVPMRPENGQTEENASTWVVSFPVASPKNCITRHDVTAIDQLEHYKKIQENWCEHNASATIYVKDSEWFEVGNWVYKNWDIINGVSFLPFDGGVYEQAPYEEITKEQYNKLVEKFPKIDYSVLSKYELEDNTTGASTLACVSGVCELN